MTEAKQTPLRCLLWLAVSSQAQAADDRVSLPEQDRACRLWAESQGMEIIATLKVEGFSRRESDVITALEDFAEQGVYAYHELRAHWQKKDFDVLIAYNHSRLGRSSTLHSWVIENVILSGARIYLIQGGWIDRDAFRFQIAIGGASSSAEIDALVRRRRVAIEQRISNGLPHSRPPISHTVIRDEKTGKALGMVVDQTKRRLLDDLATLLCEGAPWHTIELVLFERFGHVNPRTNKSYPSNTFYQMLYNPVTHGHSALNYDDYRFSAWVYDESEPTPPGVILHRNTHEPAYSGVQADHLFAELRRREQIRGKARPASSYMFSGLLICADCGHILTISSKPLGQRTRYRCTTRLRKKYRPTYPDCNQRRCIRTDTAQVQIDKLLRRLLDGQPLEKLARPQQASAIDLLTAEITDLERQMSDAITAQTETTSAAAKAGYAAKIMQIGERLDLLNAQLESEKYHVLSNEQETSRRTIALDELKEIGLETLWNEPPTRINQLLHRVMGRHRFVVEDGKIISVRVYLK